MIVRAKRNIYTFKCLCLQQNSEEFTTGNMHKQSVSVIQCTVNITVKICVLQSAVSNIFMFHSKRGIPLGGNMLRIFHSQHFLPKRKKEFFNHYYLIPALS